MKQSPYRKEAEFKNELLKFVWESNKRAISLANIQNHVESNQTSELEELIWRFEAMCDEGYLRRIVRPRIGSSFSAIPSDVIKMRSGAGSPEDTIGYRISDEGAVFLAAGGYVQKYKENRNERRWSKFSSRTKTIAVFFGLIVTSTVTIIVVLNAVFGWFAELMQWIVNLPR